MSIERGFWNFFGKFYTSGLVAHNLANGIGPLVFPASDNGITSEKDNATLHTMVRINFFFVLVLMSTHGQPKLREKKRGKAELA